MSDSPEIDAREDGPLVVKGITNMVGADGEHVDPKPVMALCRCGQSKNKPYCDGTHNDIGFSSAKGTPAGMDRVLAYEGDGYTVHFNPMVCAHAAECNRLSAHVFDAGKKPWIQPKNGTREDSTKVVAACPSGAITISEGGSLPGHMFTDHAQVTVIKDGPYWVQDVPPPSEVNGQAMTPRKYTLCRCGMSGNKPFCDGTHRDKGWSDNT